MRRESADWPEALRVNAASVKLAAALHEARAEAYAPSSLAFSQLSTQIRRAYIETAGAILKVTKPEQGLPVDVQIAPLLARQQMRVVKA